MLTPDVDFLMEETHRILTYEHRSMIDLVSGETKFPYHTIHSRLTGRVAAFDSKSLDIIKAAHFVTRSPILEGFLLWKGLRAIDNTCVPQKNIEADFNDAFMALANLLGSIRAGLEDGEFDQQEIHRVEMDLNAAEIEINHIRGHIAEIRQRANDRKWPKVVG